MKHLYRLFSTIGYKGSKNYINSQKKYEIIRTLIYFGISISLFITGYVTTKTKANLLTIVAVVGCLPASKSLIGAIMFSRYKSASQALCNRLESIKYDLCELYDMVFTSYDKNFHISHMVIAGNTVCGCTEVKTFAEKEFQTHINKVLSIDGHKNVSVKIFKDMDKYIDRIQQLNESEADTSNSELIAETLKSVAL